jgi:hypothetical protein
MQKQLGEGIHIVQYPVQRAGADLRGELGHYHDTPFHAALISVLSAAKFSNYMLDNTLLSAASLRITYLDPT